MDNNDLFMAVWQYAPAGLPYDTVRPYAPNLRNARSREAVAAICLETIFYLSKNLDYARAKARRLEAELKTLRGDTEPDTTRAIFTKPPRVAERKPAWHRPPESVKE